MCGRLPRLSRRDHRQHRLSGHLGVLCRFRPGYPLLGPRRLLRRHRGAAGARGRPRRPLRPQADLPARRRRVHRGEPALRGRSLARASDRLPRRAGRRCRDGRPDLAGPGPRRLPGRATSGWGRPLGGRRGCGCRGRADARRGAGRGFGLAAGLPRQPAPRRRDRAARARSPARAHPARQPPARPARRSDAGLGAGARHPRHRRGQRLGLDRDRDAWRLRGICGAAGRRGRAQHPAPAPDSRAGAVPAPLLPHRQPRHPALRRRLLLADPRQRPLPHRGLGLHGPPGRRRNPARAGALDRRRRPGRPSRRPLRPPGGDRPGDALLRGGRDGPALGRRNTRLARPLAPRGDPDRNRHRPRLPDPRLGRRPRRPRRPFRHRQRGQRRLPPGRRRPRHRDPRRHRRRPGDAASGPRRIQRRLPLLGSRRARLRRRRARPASRASARRPRRCRRRG